MSWRLIYVVLISSVVMLAWALVINVRPLHFSCRNALTAYPLNRMSVGVATHTTGSLALGPLSTLLLRPRIMAPARLLDHQGKSRNCHKNLLSEMKMPQRWLLKKGGRHSILAQTGEGKVETRRMEWLLQMTIFWSDARIEHKSYFQSVERDLDLSQSSLNSI